MIFLKQEGFFYNKVPYFTDIKTYLMNTKVGVRVKVVVPRGHLLGVEELGHLAPSRTARQAGGVGGVRGREGRPRGVLDTRHRLGQRGWLRRRDDADRLALQLGLLKVGIKREEQTLY